MGRSAVAEFVGTYALIFFGAGSIILTGGGDILAIAFAHGLTIAIMVSMMAHISGGIFNPAIQISLALTGKMPWARSVVHIAVQLLGAVAASLTLKYFWTQDAYDLVSGGIPAVAPGLAAGKAVVIEALTTFFLVWAVFATAVDERGPFAKLAGMTIGLTITLDILATGNLTGAAMNPARWFGPALVNTDWTNSWVYIVGPVAGGIIAGVLYWWIFLAKKEPVTP
jgi:aquaporin Z